MLRLCYVMFMFVYLIFLTARECHSVSKKPKSANRCSCMRLVLMHQLSCSQVQFTHRVQSTLICLPKQKFVQGPNLMNLIYVAQLPTVGSNLNHRFKDKPVVGSSNSLNSVVLTQLPVGLKPVSFYSKMQGFVTSCVHSQQSRYNKIKPI